MSLVIVEVLFDLLSWASIVDFGMMAAVLGFGCVCVYIYSIYKKKKSIKKHQDPERMKL